MNALCELPALKRMPSPTPWRMVVSWCFTSDAPHTKTRRNRGTRHWFSDAKRSQDEGTLRMTALASWFMDRLNWGREASAPWGSVRAAGFDNNLALVQQNTS